MVEQIIHDLPTAHSQSARSSFLIRLFLVHQGEWAARPTRLFHDRDKQQREVDIVIERHDGDVVGVEVKASASPSEADFMGVAYLREKLAPQFKAGVILHAGAGTLPFGDRLAAVPLSGLWGPTAR